LASVPRPVCADECRCGRARLLLGGFERVIRCISPHQLCHNQAFISTLTYSAGWARIGTNLSRKPLLPRVELYCHQDCTSALFRQR
jgi:hypothetical protein